MNDGEIDPRVIEVARQLTALSDAEAIPFPDVLKRMTEIGLERYHADLMRDEKIYYLPDGRSILVEARALTGPIEAVFSAEGVERAVRATQIGEIRYGEFCRRIAAAGCAGYLVTLPGRRAVYYGRSGETHVEMFPGTT